MRGKGIRGRLGVLIVLGVFLLFLAGLFGLFFELPRFYRSEMSLDFQSAKNESPTALVENVTRQELAEPASYRSGNVVTRTVNYSSRNTGSAVQGDSISVSGKTLHISEVDSPAVNAGNEVKKFRKMLYGHNSAGVFGGLSGLGYGSTFTVTLGGLTQAYRVTEIVTFEKSSSTTLRADGREYSMSALSKSAKGHSIMLLTCAGTSLGNGDATHRLAIFADAI